MQALQGVLLDVDGTLVDSNDAHAHAWVDALLTNGIRVPFEKVRRLIGKGGDKLLPEVAGVSADCDLGKAISRTRKEIFQKVFLPAVRRFANADKLLARMNESGLRLVVASSAKGDELASLLRAGGVEKFFEATTSSDDADKSKPDPDIVQAALTKIALSSSDVVLLGDTPYDVESGRNAGVAVVALRCGGWADRELSGALAIFDDPADLLAHYDDSPFAK
jgi:phosphoglycolate phosphatase-like HAD superfamily hydrolase